jgi:predicted nuclease of predicted toxin-antitoxin system
MSAALAAGLRREGVDVTTAPEVGLLQATDQEHLDFARREQRVIVTHDADFLRLHASGEPHPGIAYCAPQSRTVGEMLAELLLMWEILEPDEMANGVEYL